VVGLDSAECAWVARMDCASVMVVEVIQRAVKSVIQSWTQSLMLSLLQWLESFDVALFEAALPMAD